MHVFKYILLTVLIVALGIVALRPELLEVAHASKNGAVWLIEYIRSHPWESYSIYGAAFFIAGVLGIPIISAFMLAAGALFGFWEAVALVTFCRMAAATTCFSAARYYMKSSADMHYKPWYGKLRRCMRRGAPACVLALRLMPMVPDTMVNYGLGAMPIRARTYLVFTFIGMLPLTLLAVLAGSELGGMGALMQMDQVIATTRIAAGVLVCILLYMLYKSMRAGTQLQYQPRYVSNYYYTAMY